ncbi:38375_t:CDS:2, partial [Gigaspora margarita]
AATSRNRWVIGLDANPEVEIELPTTRMKFVFASADADDDQDNNALEILATSEPETEISSDNITIDSRQVHYSYSNAPNVYISDIMNATPRQFFERFLPVEYIMSTVIPFTNKFMTYIQCANSSDYWSSKDVIAVKYLILTDISINDKPFYFIHQFHNAFNDNLSHAITPGSYLCIDESMCQWMGKIDKGPFQRKIPRKPHPIGCEFKAVADAQANLFLRLDPAEPPEFAKKKKFSDNYMPTVATTLRLIELWFHSDRTVIGDLWFGSVNMCVILHKYGLYSILQLKKRRYWPKNIPPNITDILEDEYGSINSRKRKFDDVDLILCSLHDRKDIVLLSNCSTTSLKSEIKRYIKGHGNVKFMKPALFDEFNEYRSAIDILNNFCDNALSYHDVLSNKCSTNHFRKQLVNSIFDYYSDEPVAERAKKRQRYNKKSPNLVEHHFVRLRCDPATKKLKG